MLGILRNKKAQTTAEYAILIGLVVGAIVVMQTYVKRSLQGKIKQETDRLAPQYEPYYLSSSFAPTGDTTETEATTKGGGVTRTTQETSSRTGTQTIGAPQ